MEEGEEDVGTGKLTADPVRAIGGGDDGGVDSGERVESGESVALLVVVAPEFSLSSHAGKPPSEEEEATLLFDVVDSRCCFLTTRPPDPWILWRLSLSLSRSLPLLGRTRKISYLESREDMATGIGPCTCGCFGSVNQRIQHTADSAFIFFRYDGG